MQLTNNFSVKQINLDTFDFPKVEVHTWSNVFGKGGSVNVEAKTPEGTRITLHQQDIDENREVSSEREYAQELADEWNEDPKYNWIQEIARAYEYITDYQQKKVDEFDKEVEELKRYKEALSRIEEMEHSNAA